MRKVLGFLSGMTLDGLAENVGYPPDPGDDPETNPLWSPRMPSIDTLLLGRRTYVLWAEFWPPQKDKPENPGFFREFSRFADRCEKVVFSGSLQRTEWPNSRIVRGSPHDEVARLRAQPGGDLAVGGGPRLLQSFLDRDLVDELFVNLQPSLVGVGKPWFRVRPDPDRGPETVPIGATGRHDFQLVESRALDGDHVYLHYRRAA
jgi:dihydrofolate reductase